jgi:phage I-like protein
MDDPKPILCEVGTLDEGATRQRIQVFPGPGEYVHPKGPFTLSADELHEFADNINVAGDKIPVDRDHAFAKGMAAPAAGWFVPGTAEASEAGVSAEVEWTVEAADDIRARRYRFISPEFSFQKRVNDGRRIPEPTLLAASLTNRPFFTQMSAVAADVSLEDDLLVAEAFGDDVAELLADMGEEGAAAVITAAMTKVGSKPGSAAHTAASKYADPGYQKDGRKRYALDNEKEVRAAWSYINQARNAAKYDPADLARVKARIKRAMKKLGIQIGADSNTGGSEMDLTAEVADQLGIAADASDDDVAEAIRTLVAENASLKEKDGEKDEQMKTLIADAAAGAKAAKELGLMKRDSAIDAAVERNAILEASRAQYEGFYAIDPEGTLTLLADMPDGKLFEVKGAGDAVVLDANGDPIEADENGGKVQADLEPVTIGGSDYEVDEDSARIAATAQSILRKSGKTTWTEDEYLDASAQAKTQLGI